uniref:uncharacterized protein isoform X2 n=1 Tax=Myxine glutinosa TaxID=7769 RepID=UPI003590012F
MESVASQLRHVQEEEAQTENSSRNAEDRLEEKRRLVCQFVNESVDLMKSEINKRKMEKLSLLGKQREKLEQQMEDLRQVKSTMDAAFQDLEAVSFLQGSKDLLKRSSLCRQMVFYPITSEHGLCSVHLLPGSRVHDQLTHQICFLPRALHLIFQSSHSSLNYSFSNAHLILYNPHRHSLSILFIGFFYLFTLFSIRLL